jgi:hypothetical protein
MPRPVRKARNSDAALWQLLQDGIRRTWWLRDCCNSAEPPRTPSWTRWWGATTVYARIDLSNG